MKKVLLTAALLFAGTFGFYSCTEEEPVEPTTNVGAQIPDDQKEPEKEEVKDPVKEEVDEEAATEKLDPIPTGDNGTGCFSPSFFEGGLFGMGRSFNINYPDKSVTRCFTTKSKDQVEKFVEKGNGTEYKVYYTRNDYEYNSLETDKFSGGVSYLNIISMDGYVQKSVEQSTMQSTERLVFVATKDFGKYEYPNELLLTKEAYSYLKDGKFDAFKENYGTHYIYGCEKMATIMVVIENKVHSNSLETNNSDGIGIKGSFKGVKGYAEYDESTKQFSLNSSKDCQVYVKVTDGITISESEIENYVKSKIDYNGNDYISAVKQYLEDKVNRLTVEQAVNYKYYAMPFSKLGCEGIDWTKKKENKLTTINENYLNVQRVLNMINNYTKINTADAIFLEDHKNDETFSADLYSNLIDYCRGVHLGSNISENYKAEIEEAYSSANLTSDWLNLKSRAKLLASQLESQYDKCNDVKYAVTSSEEDYTDETEALIDDYNALYKIGYNAALTVVWGYALAVVEEESKYGTIELHNAASCNFNVDITGPNGYYKTLTMAGKTYETVKVPVGTYKIHTLQLDGYNHLFGWATEDNETVTVQSLQTITYKFNDHM